MTVRRLWAALLAAALVLALAVPALAKGAPPVKGNKHRLGFDDLAGHEWAEAFILEIHAKGLMKGVGQGKFEPHGALTRAQAITVAVRLMDLEAEAQASAQADLSALPFADALAIPGWARGYVAVAVQHKILPVSEDGLLRPNEKATRLWVSVLLVRALGYEAEAQAKMTARLPFQDAHLIPPHLVGYVAAAVDHRLVRGYGDQTFRPNQPVTRAEMAALLSRTEAILGELGQGRGLHGTVTAVDAAAGKLTLQVGDRTQEIAVDDDVRVFVAGRRAELADLQVGMKANVVLQEDGQALLIVARSTPGGESGEGLGAEYEGTVTALVPASGSAYATLAVKGADGVEHTFPVAPAVSLSGVAVGDQVEVKVVAGVVVRVKVERKASQPARDEVEGTVVAVTPASATALATLKLQTAAGQVTLPVAPAAAVEGKATSLAAIQAGDRVAVKVVAGVIIRIEVKD